MDPEQFPESARQYGVWDIPKTYLHLYGENPIVMNWDIPLESFGGMTAYEVTRDLGFPCHVSQQIYYSDFFRGMERAADITVNSPCEFGLFRSTVGEDTGKKDFFENVTTHAEDAWLEAERLAREEAEREAQRLAWEETKVEETEMNQPTEPAPKTEPEAEARRVPAVFAILAVISGILLVILVRKVLKKEK